jgi:hypothetical protein
MTPSPRPAADEPIIHYGGDVVLVVAANSILRANKTTCCSRTADAPRNHAKYSAITAKRTSDVKIALSLSRYVYNALERARI